jgi:hypothetical protein
MAPTRFWGAVGQAAKGVRGCEGRTNSTHSVHVFRWCGFCVEVGKAWVAKLDRDFGVSTICSVQPYEDRLVC